MNETCRATVQGQRRVFWATQIVDSNADECNNFCGEFGLALLKKDLPGTSIDNNGWFTGLILNILGTNGKSSSLVCRPRPGYRGGHWSDSYRGKGNNQASGVEIRNPHAFASINEAQQYLIVQTKLDLSRLIAYGVAESIDVSCIYQGSNQFKLTIVATSRDGQLFQTELLNERQGNIFSLLGVA